jgi:DNA-binding PadR family transcriptional regulator
MTPHDDDNLRSLPLSTAALHILLVLAGNQLHGYGIIQEVLRLSDGRYRIGPGTLYDNLQRLLQDGLIQEMASSRTEPRRRYYRLTESGHQILAADMKHLERAIRGARSRLSLRKPKTAQ